MRVADVFDILVISVLLYFGLLWLKQRASRPLIVGIGLIALCYVCAQRFSMYMTSSLFQVGFTAVLLALVIVFQADIRRVVERFASWSVTASTKQLLASSQTTDTIIETVRKLAEDSVGALIVVKGREPLDRHIRGGVSLGGRISFPLLYGIFNTQSPTHDGAVIIEGERIDRFAAYLPLSQNVKEGTEAGTRHAAGRGLSEVSDALVVIVSEERGTISVAEHGDLDVLDSAAQLKERLDRFYRSIAPQKNSRLQLAWIRHNLGIKALSIVVAAVLWVFVAYRADIIHRTFTVPIEWRNLSGNLFVDSIKPVEARVSLSGRERDFNFDPAAMAISLDFGAVRDGTQEMEISGKNLMNKPSHVTINRIQPQAIKVRADTLMAVELPVKVRTINKLPQGVKLINVIAEPSKVKIMVPRKRRGDVSSVSTESLNLDEVSQNTVLWLKLTIPEQTQLALGALSVVKVRISVAEKGKK